MSKVLLLLHWYRWDSLPTSSCFFFLTQQYFCQCTLYDTYASANVSKLLTVLLSFFCLAYYRILPNKDAGGSSKVTSDSLGTRLRFWACQCWFRIENWTINIIKETVLILVRYDRTGFLQTIWGSLNWQVTVHFTSPLCFYVHALCSFDIYNDYQLFWPLWLKIR